MDLKERIRVIEGFPVEGISFKDITTLLKDKDYFKEVIDKMAAPYRGQNIDLVVGPEARGFVIGAPLAYALNAGFVPIRKPGKLPADTLRYEYSLEYGKGILEIHRDAIVPGQRVLIVDDLLATGGTVEAAINMVKQLGGEIAGLAFLIELTDLGGRTRLADYNITSVVQY